MNTLLLLIVLSIIMSIIIFLTNVVIPKVIDGEKITFKDFPKHLCFGFITFCIYGYLIDEVFFPNQRSFTGYLMFLHPFLYILLDYLLAKDKNKWMNNFKNKFKLPDDDVGSGGDAF